MGHCQRMLRVGVSSAVLSGFKLIDVVELIIAILGEDMRAAIHVSCDIMGVFGIYEATRSKVDVLGFHTEVEKLVFVDHKVSYFNALESFNREDDWVEQKLVVRLVEVLPLFGSLFDVSYDLALILELIKVEQYLSLFFSDNHLV